MHVRGYFTKRAAIFLHALFLSVSACYARLASISFSQLRKRIYIYSIAEALDKSRSNAVHVSHIVISEATIKFSLLFVSPVLPKVCYLNVATITWK